VLFISIIGVKTNKHLIVGSERNYNKKPSGTRTRTPLVDFETALKKR
jgi:hypothetical protein